MAVAPSICSSLRGVPSENRCRKSRSTKRKQWKAVAQAVSSWPLCAFQCDSWWICCGRGLWCDCTICGFDTLMGADSSPFMLQYDIYIYICMYIYIYIYCCCTAHTTPFFCLSFLRQVLGYGTRIHWIYRGSQVRLGLRARHTARWALRSCRTAVGMLGSVYLVDVGYRHTFICKFI